MSAVLHKPSQSKHGKSGAACGFSVRDRPQIRPGLASNQEETAELLLRIACAFDERRPRALKQFMSCKGRRESDYSAKKRVDAWINDLRVAEKQFKGIPGCIFNDLSKQAIYQLFYSPENLLFHEINSMADTFLQATSKDECPTAKTSVEDVVPDRGQAALVSSLHSAIPWVMDQTLREPATTTPFGHSVQTKYQTLRIIRRLGMKDIALCGLYYSKQPTPECLLLEYLKGKQDEYCEEQSNEGLGGKHIMEGTIAMFNPSPEGREDPLRLMRHYSIPNAFLDVTLDCNLLKERRKAASWADRMEDIRTDVLTAVHALDNIFIGQGLVENPWRSDERLTEPGMGEISINLVDIMEYLGQDEGTIHEDSWETLKQVIEAWKRDPVFSRRVVAILTEEARGLATHHDHVEVVKRLRQIFPAEEQYRIAIHCHAGVANAHDVASIESMKHGGNGVWAAMIPQGAQNGHNNWLSFLDNLMAAGNQHVWNNFDLGFAVNAARQIHGLNFNTVDIPSGPTLWGKQSGSVHSLFKENWGWRRRDRNCYRRDVKSCHREKMKKHEKAAAAAERSVAHRTKDGRRYRIAPLVSDDAAWSDRLEELGLLPENPKPIIEIMRKMAYAIMNANIRADFNSRKTLTLLVKEAQRAHRKGGCVGVCAPSCH